MPFVILGDCCVNSDNISYFHPETDTSPLDRLFGNPVVELGTVIYFKHSDQVDRRQLLVGVAFSEVARKLSAT